MHLTLLPIKEKVINRELAHTHTWIGKDKATIQTKLADVLYQINNPNTDTCVAKITKKEQCRQS